MGAGFSPRQARSRSARRESHPPYPGSDDRASGLKTKATVGAGLNPQDNRGRGLQPAIWSKRPAGPPSFLPALGKPLGRQRRFLPVFPGGVVGPCDGSLTPWGRGRPARRRAGGQRSQAYGRQSIGLTTTAWKHRCFFTGSPQYPGICNPSIRRHDKSLTVGLIDNAAGLGIIPGVKAVEFVRTRIVYSESAFAELVLWRLPSPLPGSNHRFKYRLAYVVHGQYVLRYDNEAGKGDHRHYGGEESRYAFTDPDSLIQAFQADIARWHRENSDS